LRSMIRVKVADINHRTKSFLTLKCVRDSMSTTIKRGKKLPIFAFNVLRIIAKEKLELTPSSHPTLTQH
jgi:hypothetical protein